MGSILTSLSLSLSLSLYLSLSLSLSLSSTDTMHTYRSILVYMIPHSVPMHMMSDSSYFVLHTRPRLVLNQEGADPRVISTSFHISYILHYMSLTRKIFLEHKPDDVIMCLFIELVCIRGKKRI